MDSDFDYSSPYLRGHEPPDWSQAAPLEPDPADDAGRDAKPANPPERATRSGAAAYPYNPALRVEMQVGLDKLRCIADRELAQFLYNLHVALEPKWQGPEAKKWREQAEREREDADLKRLTGLSERAFKGEFGEPAKQLAAHILYAQGYKVQRRTDLPSLREFESEFRKLRSMR